MSSNYSKYEPLIRFAFFGNIKEPNGQISTVNGATGVLEFVSLLAKYLGALLG
jgi:hypothetical protein